MRNLSIFTLSITIALGNLFSQSAQAQPTITGFVTEVSSTVTVLESKQVKKFKIGFYIQIHNPSSDTLIVFRPGGFVGSRKINFLSATGSVEDTSTITLADLRMDRHATLKRNGVRGLIEYPDKYDWLASELDDLAKQEVPKSNTFVFIEPGSYFEFRESVDVENGFEIDEASLSKIITKERNLYNARISKARSPYIQIEYILSTQSYSKDSSLLRTLQSKWQKFGKLPLDGDTYRLKSEPMLLNLPATDGNP